MTAFLNILAKKGLVLSTLVIFSLIVTAQDVIPTKGKEFWAGFMENYEPQFSESLDLFITSDINTSGTVSIPLQGWEFDFTVNANQTTTVTVPNNLAEHVDENQIISQRGVFIETEDTVSVFAINFDQFTADGTKILPTKSLGTEYRVPAYIGLSGYPSLGSTMLVVATEDDTEVEIVPSADTPAGNAAGVPFTVQLDRGESYQIILDQPLSDLTGTVVRATEASGECRPFAVFSGSSCTNIPDGCAACDHIYEQNFSVDTWGTEYYVVPYEFADSYAYRVLAHEDGTEVTINGAAPITLNAGDFQEFNNVEDPACITTNLPALVVQYMQGTTCSGTGDPAMLILNDASQKINTVTMSTVLSPQITNHGINVILETVDVGTFTVDGTVIDPANFTQFPDCPTHSYAQLSVTEGSHTLTAPNGFTAYAFGLGNAESYSYSVGSFSPNPFGDIEIEEAVCSSDQIVLVADDPGFDLFWYNLDFPDDTLGNDPVLILEPPIISGVYAVAYNNLVSGCENEEFFSVEVPEPPILDNMTDDQIICQYESVQLNVVPDPFNSFYLYSWSPTIGLSNASIANPVATPLTTTTYEVTVSTPTGCAVAVNSVTITVQGGQFSNLEAFADDYELCQGESAQIEVEINEITFEDNFDPGISWGIWEDISNGEQTDVCGSISENALHFNGTGQRSAETIEIDVSNGGFISFALQYGEGTAPCDAPETGEDVVLEYSTNGGANWFIIETIYSFTVNGWEQFNIPIPEDAESINTAFRWRQLTNSGIDQDNWSLDNIAISTLSASDLDYSWSPSEGLSADDISNPIATPMADITYLVEVIDDNSGCTYLDSVSFDVGQNFTLEITPDTVLCDIQGIDLEVIPSTNDQFDFLWTPNDGTISSVFSSSPTVTPSSTTVYEVEVSSNQGCVNTAEVEITVNQLLDLSVTASEIDICAGESTVLNAQLAGNPSGIDYEWSPAESLDDNTLAMPEATPATTTQYEVVATDSQSGCSLSDNITINVSGGFTVDAGEDQVVCDAIGLDLQALPSQTGSYQWNWQPALEVSTVNSANTTVVNNTTNEFIVSATDDGCTQTDTVLVTVIFESFDLGADIEICDGEEATLDTGFPDAQHEWNTTEDTSSITVSEEQLYTVTVTSDLGCSIEDDIYVTVLELPEVDLGEDQNLCVGDSYNLNAGNGGVSYEWSTAQASQVITVLETDTYSVEVTDVNNCVNTDEVLITFNENPTAELADVINICEDEFALLDAGNPGSSYEWNLVSDETQTISVNQTGTYVVSVTNPENCTTVDEIEVLVSTYPSVDLGPDVALCEGETIFLNSGAGADLNVNWNTTAQSSSIEVSQSAEYSVTVDNDYCFTTDEISVIFNPLPTNNIPEDTTVCFVTSIDPLILDASNFGSTYEWSTGSTESTAEISLPGVYSVLVTSAFGCENTFFTEVNEVCFGPYMYIPNSFTPNGDGDNDAWKPEGIFVLDYEMRVFNRWGEVVFESNDFDEFWLGDHKNGDHYVPEGVYSYQMRFKYVLNEFGTPSDWSERVGQVSIVR